MIFRLNPRIFPLNPMKSIYTIGFPMCNSPSNEVSKAIVKGAPGSLGAAISSLEVIQPGTWRNAQCTAILGDNMR